MNLPWNVLSQGLVISLGITLALELLFAGLWGIRERRDWILVVLGNVLTNPIVVFVYYYVRIRHSPLNYGWITIGLEVYAVCAEALLYQKYGRDIQRPWLFSLSANAFSYAVGELINGVRWG